MPPEREQRIQTLKRAQYLKNYGYNVYVICGSYLHNTNVNLISDDNLFINQTYDNIKFIHIRNLSYFNSNILRVFSLLQFYIRLFKVSKMIEKPDVISLCATTPFSNMVYFLARKFKSKFILDIVDLWPESFVALGLVSKYNPILWFAYKAEEWIYKKADKIVFSMEGGADYIKEKKKKDIL